MVYYRRASQISGNPKLKTKNTVVVTSEKGAFYEGDEMLRILEEKKANGVEIVKLTAFWFSTNEDPKIVTQAPH